MEELDIDMRGHRSKPLSDIADAEDFDIVITLCDEASEAYAVWIGSPPQFHIGFPDLAAAAGTEEERLRIFRDVRDNIREKLFPFLEDRAPELDARRRGVTRVP